MSITVRATITTASNFVLVMIKNTIYSNISYLFTACEDLYVRGCKFYGKCDSPFYNVRKFADENCPKTCGRCGK